ncbi:hypothetical protein B9T26_07335 [Acinetobacter sp. ANC 4169]|nr:hypothetical protein B9T26_07335 [Acinetobacter sp. ANC 4169]
MKIKKGVNWTPFFILHLNELNHAKASSSSVNHKSYLQITFTKIFVFPNNKNASMLGIIENIHYEED